VLDKGWAAIRFVNFLRLLSGTKYVNLYRGGFELPFEQYS